jgi:hypothetical protein
MTRMGPGDVARLRCGTMVDNENEQYLHDECGSFKAYIVWATKGCRRI